MAFIANPSRYQSIYSHSNLNVQPYISAMNITAVRKLLQNECDELGLDALAAKAGVSSGHMHNVLVGARKPRGQILDMLNLKVVEDYRPRRPRA
jgi:hypothetical protein